jgi:type I restriction enzyme S subunit
MMKLAPYPEYKDAEVSWVGSIPAHWPEKRAKYYFKEIDQRSETGDEEMLSVSHITGVTPRSQKNVTMFKAESNVGQKRCQPGDLIINTMWAWMSALGVSTYTGIVSPAYGVYRPRSNQDYDYYYLDSLLRIEGYRSEYICRSTGIRSSRLRLYPDKFLSMPVVCPPQEEQLTMARFLKAQDRLFRKFIRNKRRFIELLKEQKQNVINQAVTRGLDPKVNFKPSGVEWIGDIPEHWETMRVKFLFVEREERKGDEKFELLSFSRSKGLVPFSEMGNKPPSAEDLSKYKVCRSGHLLMNRMQAWSGMFTDVLIEGIVSPDYSVFEPIRPMSVAYFSYLFKTKRHVDEFAMASRGLGDGFNRLYTPAFGAIRTLCPPVDEQNEIVEFIKQETAIIDVAILRAELEIELMREYRTRLISDVVTGQLDVRGIEVPEFAEEELLALEEDTGDADGVIDDEGDMDETD